MRCPVCQVIPIDYSSTSEGMSLGINQMKRFKSFTVGSSFLPLAGWKTIWLKKECSDQDSSICKTLVLLDAVLVLLDAIFQRKVERDVQIVGNSIITVIRINIEIGE